LLANLRNQVGQYLPTSPEELYTLQVLSMIVFTIIAIVIANIRKYQQRLNRIDFHYVVKNVGAGATFPVSALLILYPVFPIISSLLNTLGMYLSVAGMFGIILGAYSIIR
jgi:hypothetical protein